MREDPISKPSSRITPSAAPFTPSRTTSSAYVPRAATPLANVSVPPTPTQAAATIKVLDTPASKAKNDVKTLATNSGLSKAIASQASTTAVPSTTLQAEEFPALEKGAPKPASTSKNATPIKASKKAAVASSTSAAPSVVKASEKRSTPGILNIAVGPKSSSKPVATVETHGKSIVAPAAFPPLPVSTSTATVQAPVPRALPKTLRVVPTPKTELPPSASTPPSTTSMFPPTLPPSRQPSLASASRLERPGTPTSEIVSETASITSASFSRTNSPPPSKVGSAPVRTTTKSMQKKQRREAQKEKLEAVAVKPEPEVEVGPIMGRKKKQKKEKPPNSAAGGSTPAISRAPSPGPVELPKEVVSAIQPSLPAPEKPSLIEKDAPRVTNKMAEIKAKVKTKTQRTASPERPSVAPEEEEGGLPEKPLPTPASVFSELVSAGVIPDDSDLHLLKPPAGLNTRHELSNDMWDIDQKLTITPEDRSALLSGTPVHKVVEGSSRILLTPNGDCVRNLSPEEEERYLELQSRIAEEAGPTAFYSAKHHANNGFTLIGGRAVPNGPPAFFPLAGGNMQPIDPVSKIQRDEALSYINQYVLPSLSTNSQLEKALNANALDAEMMRTHESSTWASWGNDAMSPGSEHNEGPYGPTNQDGILATGLENMTAHFAVGRENERGQPLGNVSLLSLTESESAMQVSRKETEGFEKKLNQLLKKNRRLLLGTSH